MRERNHRANSSDARKLNANNFSQSCALVDFHLSFLLAKFAERTLLVRSLVSVYECYQCHTAAVLVPVSSVSVSQFMCLCVRVRARLWA